MTLHALQQMPRPSLSLTEKYISVVGATAEMAVKCLIYADQVVQKVPVANYLRDRTLDTLLGPKEPIDPRPITAPFST